MDKDLSPPTGAESAGATPGKPKATRTRSKTANTVKKTTRAPRKKVTKTAETPEFDLGPEAANKPKPRSRKTVVKKKVAVSVEVAKPSVTKVAIPPPPEAAPAAKAERPEAGPAAKAERPEAGRGERASSNGEGGTRTQPSQEAGNEGSKLGGATDAVKPDPESTDRREEPRGERVERNDRGNRGNRSDRRDRGAREDRGPREQPAGGEGDGREPRWKRGAGGSKDNKRGAKRGKWKQGADRERPPAQPLPPGMSAPMFGELPDPETLRDLAALDTAAQASRDSSETPIQLRELYPLAIAELASRGRELGAEIEGVPGRHQWLEAIFKVANEKSLPMRDTGWLDLSDNGDGFVVHDHVAYRLYPENTYIPPSLVKRYGLLRGHEVEVVVRPPRGEERCPVVIGVDSVMGRDPTTIAAIPPFVELEPYYPLKRILMEAPVHKDISMRAVDLLTPIGFGQRGLIVAPPRTGKTVLLQNMANSISHNFPEMKLILLLIDERPEEVTDFKRNTKGEVVSSTFDEAPTNHVHAAEMVIEKARRLVELGEHVVILLDSITRLARAYNALASNSGKIMSGGIEATAMQKPKRFFGSARNIEGAGSLTILGTALVDTNSKMDEVIFEEFKGTGNMELHLDRGLSDKRIFPAINIDRSGTRKEELIYHPAEMERVFGLRRAMQGIPPVEAMEMFITRLRKTKSNAEFLMSLNK